MSHPGAPGGALASNPLPRWEKLAMEASLWVRFTATERRERGAAPRVLIDRGPAERALARRPCTALCVIDRAP